MPIARFEMPDGRIARFEVPEGTTPEQAQAMVEAEIPNLPAAGPVEPPELPQRTLGTQVGRGVGRTARAAVQSVAALPELVTRGALSMYDLGAGGIESLTGIPQTRYAERAGTVKGALTKFGLPEAENPTERFAEDVAGGMAGAGGIVKLGVEMAKRGGTALSKKLGELLSTAPARQAVAGGTGPGAAGIVREEGGGTGAQVAAGVAGSFSPSVPVSLEAMTRALIRGGAAGRQRVAQNIDTFEGAGASAPTVGQATESRLARAVESTLARIPGSAGRMVAKAESEAAGMGQHVDDMAARLAPRSGAEPAGREIATGIKGFSRTFKANAGKLYDEVDRFVLPESRIGVGNTMKALDDLTAVTPGAESLSTAGMNPKIVQLRANLVTDAADGTLPYAALKAERTRIGDMLGEPTLTSDIPRSQLKAVYGAITADLEEAARAAGPEAVKALKRANKFYKTGMKRIDDVLEPVLAKGDPEKIFLAATSGMKEGATTIRGVMKSLPEESRKVVAATMLRRLGKADPGQQNALGETFSADKFLSNWNRIDAQAKKTLFASLPEQMRVDLDKISKATENIKRGSKVFANPSGTAQAMATTGGLTAFGVLLATGQLGGAGAIAAGAAGANIQARLMTSPGVVHWLAATTRAPAEQLPAQLNLLFQQSLHMRGEERREVRDFIKQAREAAASR